MSHNTSSSEFGSRNVRVHTNPGRPPASELFSRLQPGANLADIAPLLRADLAPLRALASPLRCRVIIRPPAGDFISILSAGENAAAPESFVCFLDTPVSDPCGQEVGTLELQVKTRPRLDRADSVLTSLLHAARLALTERWFRIHHRRSYVLAARRTAIETPQCILFALDGSLRVVGASRGTQGTMDYQAIPADAPLALSRFFACNPRNVRTYHRDRFLTLSTQDGKELWDAVLTPADVSLNERLDCEKVVLHTRPRLHLIAPDLPRNSVLRPALGLPPRVLRQVKALIEARLDAELTITTLAEWAGMSVSHFTRSFQISVGVTPHLYVMQRRLLKAQAYLVHSALPLSQIALETGFADQSHFSRRFHRETGMPPLRYRLMYRSAAKQEAPCRKEANHASSIHAGG